MDRLKTLRKQPPPCNQKFWWHWWANADFESFDEINGPGPSRILDRYSSPGQGHLAGGAG